MARAVAKIGTLGGLVALAAMLGSTALAEGVTTNTLAWSIGTYGAPGLIDMPTAETLPDGALNASVAAYGGSVRGNFAFQVAPRVTGTLRFSREDGLGPGGDTLKDRSFDLHWQMFDEQGWRPALAVGMRDIFGNAVHGSEYIVATKTLTPSLRGTLGIGWGRLGTKGGSGGSLRPAPDTQGGLNADLWFKGPAAPFAGLAWQANDKLTLKAEISSDAYLAETAAAGFDRKTSLNLGLDYRFNQMASVSAYLLHGSEVGFQFNIALDPRQPPAPSGLERAPLPVRPRPAPAADPQAWSTDWAADPTARPAIQRVMADSLKKDGQILESMALSATHAELRLRNETYDAQPQALGHAARIATRALPASVETITITQVAKGMPTASVTFRRTDLETLENTHAGAILAQAQIGEAPLGTALTPTEGLYPRLQWAIAPYLELSTFDPGQDLRADVGVSVAAKYEIVPGVVLSGKMHQRAFGNLEDSTKVSTSTAPHVRSDIARYQKHGDLALDHLTMGWYARPAENIYTRVTAGYLERMYGGVSGEILWKPVDSRLALGAELNWVKKRDFDQHFGFRNYDTVSGHVSAYYDFGKGVTGQLDVGRYLAEDWGATLSVDRELANGWRIGAFATLTDMSEQKFGKGGFDKGVRLTIPLGWATGTPTLATFNPTIRPFTGDGGARVEVEDRLYEAIRGTHTGALYEEWGRFWR